MGKEPGEQDCGLPPEVSPFPPGFHPRYPPRRMRSVLCEIAVAPCPGGIDEMAQGVL